MTETTLVYPLQWVSASPTRGCGRGVGEEHLLDGQGRSLAFTRVEKKRGGDAECDVSLYVGGESDHTEDAWSGTLSRRDRPSLRRSTFLVEGQLFGPNEQQVAIRAEFKRRSVREIIVEIGERSFLMQRCGVVNQARHIVDMETGDHALMLIEILRPRLQGMENLPGPQGLGMRGSKARGAGERGSGARRPGVRGGRPFVRANQSGAEPIREELPGQDAGSLKIPAARELAVYEIAVLCWVSAQVDMTWLEMRG